MSISRRAFDYRVEEERRGASEEGVRAGMWTRYLVPLGRVAFAAVFIVFTPPDFTPQGIAEAAQQGVPLAPVLVPLAGLIALAGGASVILGYRARVGAWLLILFLVPVTILLHNFWAVRDPMMAQMQFGFFLANVSRIGTALLIAYFGAGPFSFDERAAAPRPKD
jgi:putative oxidoreductase